MAEGVELNTGPDEPSLKALLNELHPVRASWYNIGVQLDIPHTTLDCFKLNYSHPSDLMREMLKCWLDTAVDPHPTWEAVVKALMSPSVNKTSVAEQVKSKYCAQLRHNKKESNDSGDVENSKGPQYQNSASFMNVSQLKALEDQRQQSHGPASEYPATSAAQQSSNTSSSSTKGSEKPPFGCGCGKCTFFTFIMIGCSKPIPSVSLFPYLDLSGLTPEQQQMLRGSLRNEFIDITMQFQYLVSTTLTSLQKQHVKVRSILSHLMKFETYEPVLKDSIVPVFHQQFQNLEKAERIEDIFWILKDYMSFFNYHVIDHIINGLGTEKDKAELKKYKANFQQYAKRRVYQCPPQFGPVSEAGHADIFVKVDFCYEDYTVVEIEVFKQKLSKLLTVSCHGVLRLCLVVKDSFQFTFQVPSVVKDKIFPLSEEQERALADEGITWLVCGEYQFQNQKDELSETELV